jgi:hypothetical protein
MRGLTRTLAAIAAIALAGTMTACSSDSKSGPKTVAQLKTITSGTTTVRLDPSFPAALGGPALTPTAFGTAKITKSGSATEFVFPVTGGNVTLDDAGDVRGEIAHKGSGLTFASGGTEATAKDFVMHLGNDPNLTAEIDLNGAVAFKSLRLFDLDTTTMTAPAIKNGVATLAGVTIYLSSVAATDLNVALNTTTLAGGKTVKIGTATIEATGS